MVQSVWWIGNTAPGLDTKLPSGQFRPGITDSSNENFSKNKHFIAHAIEQQRKKMRFKLGGKYIHIFELFNFIKFLMTH